MLRAEFKAARGEGEARVMNVGEGKDEEEEVEEYEFYDLEDEDDEEADEEAVSKGASFVMEHAAARMKEGQKKGYLVLVSEVTSEDEVVMELELQGPEDKSDEGEDDAGDEEKGDVGMEDRLKAVVMGVAEGWSGLGQAPYGLVSLGGVPGICEGIEAGVAGLRGLEEEAKALVSGSDQETTTCEKMVMQNNTNREMSKIDIVRHHSLRYDGLTSDQRRVLFNQLGDMHYKMYRQAQADCTELHTLRLQQDAVKKLSEKVLSKVTFLMRHLGFMAGRMASLDEGLTHFLAAPENAEMSWVSELQESRRLGAGRKKKPRKQGEE